MNQIQKTIASLVETLAPKMYEFQKTGYSFEEWFNWELYYSLCDAGYDVRPKPKIEGTKSFADIAILNFMGNKKLVIEVKLIHDYTQNKWLTEIEKDRSVLKYNSIDDGAIGLQLLLVTSSYDDVLSVKSWSEWLKKLSFWSEKPTMFCPSNQNVGSTILIGWEING